MEKHHSEIQNRNPFTLFPNDNFLLKFHVSIDENILTKIFIPYSCNTTRFTFTSIINTFLIYLHVHFVLVRTRWKLNLHVHVCCSNIRQIQSSDILMETTEDYLFLNMQRTWYLKVLCTVPSYESVRLILLLVSLVRKHPKANHIPKQKENTLFVTFSILKRSTSLY